MKRIIEIRYILGIWCVKASTASGSVVLACGETQEDAIEKALRVDPEPA